MGTEKQRFKTDFGFVCDRVGEFFSRRTVGRALELIDEVGITGWEKWWQVEFAAWLSDHDQISEWVMEEVFLTDLRRNTSKNSIAIDLGFRMKGYSTKEMLFLELKQNHDFVRCVDNMLTDAEKLYTAQTYSGSGLKIRNFFLVGVYPSGELAKKVIHDYIVDRAEERDIEVDRSHIWTKFVPNSSFSVTVF